MSQTLLRNNFWSEVNAVSKGAQRPHFLFQQGGAGLQNSLKLWLAQGKQDVIEVSTIIGQTQYITTFHNASAICQFPTVSRRVVNLASQWVRQPFDWQSAWDKEMQRLGR
jgi:hypothetical protein